MFSRKLRRAVLVAGSALLLVSRGLVEARGPQREEFGLDRLHDILIRLPCSSADEICIQVLDTVKQFAEQAPRMRWIGRRTNQLDSLRGVPNDITALALVRGVAL